MASALRVVAALRAAGAVGVVILAAVFLFRGMAYGQAAANISGTVSDPSGAVISGAHVTLENPATGVAQSTVTNSTGTYTITAIRPGTYTLSVRQTGFQASHLTNVVLGVGQSAILNFTLKPGTVTQSVTVNASATQIQSSTAALGTVIGTKSVSKLPLNGRNFTELLELTPGVSRISTGQNSGGGGGFAGNAIGSFTFPAVNGQRNRSNTFLLDGVSDLNAFIGQYNYEPIVDQIQEFRVESYNDQAEFGQVLGGVVNVITKSGTNRFHGSLWEFLRNSAFDARDYFIPTVNPLRQNQFGGTFGGPVYIPHVYNGRRGKSFFFFTYEGFRQSQAAQNVVTTPTSAQLNGDFSALLQRGVVIYNPFTTRPDPAHPGEFLRDPFPNNQIPTSMISPAALLYAKTLFPAPNASLPSGHNLIDTTPSTLNMDSFSGRIDQSFGSHDQLFGRVSSYNETFDSSAGYPGFMAPGSIYGYNMVVHETHMFGPTSIMQLFFGRNIGDDLTERTFPFAPADFASKLEQAGFSNSYLGGFLRTHP